nr:hypothetical protein [Polaromonas naphthalenivorans]
MPCCGWPARTPPGAIFPSDWGKWSAVYQRYAYWCGKGHCERLFKGAQQPDLEAMMVDSTC